MFTGILHHSHQIHPHRLMTSPNSRLRILFGLVVAIPSVDDLPLNIISSVPGKKISHLLSFLRSIEIAFVKLLREPDLLCRREVCAFPLLSYIRCLVLGTLLVGAVSSTRSSTSNTTSNSTRSSCTWVLRGTTRASTVTAFLNICLRVSVSLRTLVKPGITGIDLSAKRLILRKFYRVCPPPK